MFDVITVAQKDADLYRALMASDVCCSGYFQIRMATDPRTETSLFKHAIDPRVTNPVGRAAVIEHLRKSWGFALPGLSGVSLGAADSSGLSTVTWLGIVTVAIYVGYKLGASVIKSNWEWHLDYVDHHKPSDCDTGWARAFLRGE